MKKIKKFIVLLLVAGLAWTAWAAGALYDLMLGLQNGDPVALERRIDWNGVRQALREDLQAGPMAAAGGPAIDALLSAPALANLLRTGKLDDRGWETVAQPSPKDVPVFDLNRIRYAFYTGSPFSIRVDIRPDGETFDGPLVLLFRWTGDWRLVRIFLPAAASAKPVIALQPSPPPSPPPVAPSPTLPPGAQRAILYEEVPGDQQGKRYTGLAMWRAEQAPPSTAGASPFAVTVQVAVSERPLNMTMSIRRNMDPMLPATHTIEINFTVPPNSTTGGVTDAVGVMMKPDEEAPGVHLAGSRVKVRDGQFMLGLSALDIDARTNVEALRTRPWFGIPLRFGNGSRAVLVIEKGDAGEKAFGEAFTRWNATSGTSAQKK